MSVGALLLFLYFLLRIVGDPFFWQNISPYYGYAFDIVFVAISYGFFRKRITLWRRPRAFDFILLILNMAFGAVIYKAANWMSIPVPFELSDAETIILLLVMAPLLEELIFRMALWEAIQSIGKNQKMTIVATTVLFAIGHLTSYWLVPEPFQSFIIYQTVYVLVLGAILGWRRSIVGAVSASILLHFGFNLGFFLAGTVL